MKERRSMLSGLLVSMAAVDALRGQDGPLP